jgi:protein-tyrosine phosphatase
MQDRLVPLDGPANFRDLGGYENDHGRFVRTGRVYRSDSLSFMSVQDVQHVTEVLGLRTVIDLRAGHEVAQFTHGPLESLTVDVWHVPIIDETRQPPSEPTAGATVAIDEIYLMMLERFGHRFVAVLELIAVADAQPVVFHCAAGKDRTGLVAMLVLGLLEVSPDIIATDYALTHERMPILLERHQARAAEGGVAEVAQQRWAIDAAAMRAVIQHLLDNYGSVAGYVRAHGLSPERIEQLRSTLLVEARSVGTA